MAMQHGVTGGAGMTGAAPGQTIDHDETYSLIGSDKVEGTDVRRSNGDKVGTIERLMIDKRSGRVAYAVMSFGGFLGLGVNRMPVPWEMLRYREELDAYEMDVTEDQLRGAPPTPTTTVSTGRTPTGTGTCAPTTGRAGKRRRASDGDRTARACLSLRRPCVSEDGDACDEAG